MRTLILAAMVAALIGSTMSGASRHEKREMMIGGKRLAGCVSRPPGSRWAAGIRRYELTHQYGHDVDEWLGGVGGLGTDPEGKVYVYDRVDPRVVVLSDTMTRVREFGRVGGGPGEFLKPTMVPPVPKNWDFNYLHVADSLVYVYDGEGIEVFGLDGGFRRHISGVAAGMFVNFGVRFISSGYGAEVLYVIDSLDIRDLSTRRLQTWSVRGRDRTLVWEMPLTAPPELEGSGYVMKPRQARPSWAGHGDCQLASDGSSHWLFRFNRATTHLDSLQLPDWEVPPYQEGSGDPKVVQSRQRLRAIARQRFGRTIPDDSRVRPTVLWRWAEVVVDPDGYAWIKPWRDNQEVPVPVVRVNVNTGAVAWDSVPAFPRAFGRPGVFYTVESDPETDEALISRYELTSR